MATNTAKKKAASGSKASNTASKGKGATSRSAGAKTAPKKTAVTKTSNRKTTGSGRTEPAAFYEQKPREQTNPLIVKEAALWLILAVCILIFISYFGIGGYVGEMISDISFGTFGLSAYVFPLLFFTATAFLIVNRGSRIAGLKFASSVGLYLCVCSFTALLSSEYDTVSNFRELYEMSAAKKSGGGIVGGFLCGLLRPALGDIGTGLILVILALICGLLITQKSLMRGVKQQSSRMYHSAKENGVRRRQERARREEEWVREQEVRGIAETEEFLKTEFDSEQKIAAQTKENRNNQRRYSAHETQAWPSQKELRRPSGEMRSQYSTHPSKPVEADYAQNRKYQAQQGRTEIDVPVLFPVYGREHRAERRITGVTMDTKLQGRPERIGAEIHEILPKRQPEAPVPTWTERTQPAQDGGPVNDTAERETSYIDLEQVHPKKKSTGKKKKDSGLEVYQESVELHIEGLPEQEGVPQVEELSKLENKSDSSVMTAQKEPDFSAFTKLDEPDCCDDLEEISVPEAEVVSETVPSAKKQSVNRQELSKAAPATAENSSAPKKQPRSSQQEIEDGIASVEAEAAESAKAVCPEYVYPPLTLLKKGKGKSGNGQEQEIRQTAAKLQQTLDSFGVHVTVTNVSCGPSVTRYELQPEQGVKVSRIVSLSDDIKLNLAAADIRIEAPIPGKAAVGIEVPNAENSAVALRDLLESDEFQNHKSRLAFATGKDIGGKVVVSDIAKMPHLLIAGATGSGKSVCINTLIMSILYKAHPDDVKLIMIDPKVVELSVYNGIPHLFIPVVTDPKKAAGALNWGVAEMTDRYNKFAEFGVRDLAGYNKKIEALADIEDENKPKKLPQIVIIVDELADLMMVAPGEVEDSICRLAQLARAAGIHLIIATQRPSVNVITGLIKANMPSRIAFSVTSNVDSRTIIDMAGAEKLLGKGDMLFYPQGYQKPARVQGAFVSDEEVSDVVDFLKNKNTDVSYSAEIQEQIAKVQSAASAARGDEDCDALFADAGKFIIDKDKASIGMLQRVFKIGFNRAARIMDQLSEAGVVGPEEGTKPRKILMSAEEFENYLEQN